ncbi:hypothetical protein [Paenarthrobacter sp. 2TAF44]|uniref:hypothetical protein n=1 Tax=Paenarthrobacter sp. 2TAF44 TaxID=3233018 RepID=UPI003F984417
MIGSVLFLMVGLGDFVVRGLRFSLPIYLLVLVVIALLAIFGLGFQPQIAIGCMALSLGWMRATRPLKSSKPGVDSGTPAPRLWPAVVLFALVFVITAYDQTPETARGFIVDAYSSVALKSATSTSLEAVLAAGAVGIFLLKSANDITLAALGRAHKSDPADTPTEVADASAKPSAVPHNKWELFVRNVRLASVRSGEKPNEGPKLKGGRIIGPIERLLIVVLAFAGTPQIIAALAAAKGIVRFPEISEDRSSGSKAEEFLVGSLTSWTLSALAVLYISLVSNG